MTCSNSSSIWILSTLLEFSLALLLGHVLQCALIPHAVSHVDERHFNSIRIREGSEISRNLLQSVRISEVEERSASIFLGNPFEMAKCHQKHLCKGNAPRSLREEIPQRTAHVRSLRHDPPHTIQRLLPLFDSNLREQETKPEAHLSVSDCFCPIQPLPCCDL